jgi:hypothetical protein
MAVLFFEMNDTILSLYCFWAWSIAWGIRDMERGIITCIAGVLIDNWLQYYKDPRHFGVAGFKNCRVMCRERSNISPPGFQLRSMTRVEG